MSKTKQFIDQLKQKGVDPLNENHEDFVDGNIGTINIVTILAYHHLLQICR